MITEVLSAVVSRAVVSSAGAYEPDRQDELMGDAEAVGGRAFVHEVTYLATELTTRDLSWSGHGPEPAGYRQAWLDHAQQIIADRRAQLRPRQG